MVVLKLRTLILKMKQGSIKKELTGIENRQWGTQNDGLDTGIMKGDLKRKIGSISNNI